MKKINLFYTVLIIVLLLSGCDSQKTGGFEIDQVQTAKEIVGVNKNGEFKLVNETELKSQWEKRLLKLGYANKIKSFRLENEDLFKSGESNLILVATSIDSTIKMAVALEEIDNNYFEVLSKGSVVCKGCRRGCHPKEVTGGWDCTDCEIKDSSCVKTETGGDVGIE